MGINISIIFPNTGCHGLEIIWAIGSRLTPGIDHLSYLSENPPNNLTLLTPFFRFSSEKKRASHSRSGRVYGKKWGKLHGRIHIDCMGIGGLWARGKSAVFWQTGQYLTIFSTRTEKEPNLGFPGSGLLNRKRKGARFGRIFLQLLHPGRHGFSRLFWFPVSTGFLGMIGVVELLQKGLGIIPYPLHPGRDDQEGSSPLIAPHC
jgi:hypothetical protein